MVPVIMKKPSKVARAAKTIMIVDDDEIFLEELGELLTESGYETVTESDPSEAAWAVQRIKPDVVIMDLSMRRKSGFEVADDIQNIPEIRDLPIIVVSGFWDHGFSPLSNWRNIRKFIRKPFNPFYVVQAIEQVLKETAIYPEAAVDFQELSLSGADTEGELGA